VSRRRRITDMHPLPTPERLADGRVRCMICGGAFKARPDGQPVHHRAGCAWSIAIKDIGTPRARWRPSSKNPTPMTRWRVWQKDHGDGRVRCVLSSWTDELDARRFANEVDGTIEEARLSA
jgi:hypothetical protein